jgi:DamX protein
VEEPDPVLDAVIEAAIAAAAQPPEPDLEPPPQAEVEQAEENQPTPVPEVQAPEAATSATPQPQEVKPPQRVPSRTGAAENSASDGYETWLRAQAPGAYTLQLVGARDTDAIQKFIARHNVESPYAVFQRDLNGEPWYSLVAGVYADRDAAVAARSRLAPPLNGSGVWPRTFASIVEQLQNKP